MAAVATVAMLAFAVLYFGQSPPSRRVVEFSMTGPEGLETGEIALSPDGRHLVVSVTPIGSLWVRPLDSLEWRQLEGTSGSRYPFWSPDSDEIGFFADGRLKKVALTGGPAQTIAKAPSGRGGSWGADGTIVLSPIRTGGQISSVPESGGEPVPVAEPADTRSSSRRFPHLLPDGRHFLFTNRGTSPELTGVFLGSLDGEAPRRLLPDYSNAVFMPRDPQAGFLLFVRDDTLMAQPFNLSQLEFAGGPIALPETPARGGQLGFYQFAASASGLLAHAPSGSAGQRRLVWLDRTGATVDTTNLVASGLGVPTLSPDGESVAYISSDEANLDVWTYDLDLGTRTLLSNNQGIDSLPVWSPDAANVAFTSQQGSTLYDIFLSPADGSSRPVVLYATEVSEAPLDWSRDGRSIVFASVHPETGRDVWYLERTVAADGWEPHLFLSTSADEKFPRLSPDGRYVAYVSNESGRSEIYVQPFPDGGRRTTVSTAGGDAPIWSRDGKELFYVDPDNTLTAVEVSMAGGFTISGVTRLFQRPSLVTLRRQNYDVSLDGQRFLTTEPVDAQGEAAATQSSIRVIMNWREKFAPEQ